MECSKCGQEMKEVGNFLVCGECGATPKDNQDWYIKLVNDPECWYEEAFTKFPYIISHEYKRLRDMLRDGETYGSLLQIKDTFEVLLKFPMLIIIEGCIKHVQQLIDADTFNADKLKAENPSVHYIIETMLGKALSFGDWEQMAYKARKIDAGKQLPTVRRSMYEETIKLLKTLMDNYKFTRHEGAAEENISAWRNSTIGHGALAFNHEEGFQKDFSMLLNTLENAMECCAPTYRFMKLRSDSGAELDGWEVGKETLDAVKKYEVCLMTESIGEQKLELEPYMLHTADKSYLFDSYTPWKQVASVLNYSHGKKDVSSELRDRLVQLNKSMQIAAIESTSIYNALLDKKDIEAVEALMMTKEILKPEYMHDWLTGCLEAHDRGVFLLRAERGMGKTAFTKAIDGLDTCKYKSEKSLLPDTITRVWHFNTTDASRIDSFKSGLADLLKYLRELGERGEVVDAAKFSAEMDTRVSEFTAYWETDFEKQKQNTADFFGYIMKAYQTKRQFEKLLIVFDGLDEIKSIADVEKGTDGDYSKEYQERYGKFSIFDFIPNPKMLSEGVYILLTSRTDFEVEGNRYVEDRINKLKLTETLELDRKNVQYKENLKKYIQREILKSDEIEAEAVAKLLEKLECRFIYASAYKKLYLSSSEEGYSKGERMLPFFLEKIRIGSKAYYEQSLSFMLLLAIANDVSDPLTLKELSWLMGDEMVTYKTLALINDMRSFVDFQRSYRGDLIGLSHEEWRRELAEAYPKEMEKTVEILRMKFNKFYKDLSRNDRDKKKINLAEKSYDGESWLSVNIMNIMDSRIEDCESVSKFLEKLSNTFDTEEKSEYAIKRRVKVIDQLILTYKELESKGINYNRNDLAMAYIDRGNEFDSLVRGDEMLRDYNECIVILEAPGRDGELYDRRYLAMAYMNCGNAFSRLKRFEEALKVYNMCIAIIEALDSNGKNVRDNLAMAYMNRGSALRRLERLEESLRDENECIAILEALYIDEKLYNVNDLALAYMNRGVTFDSLGSYEEALIDYNGSIEIREVLDSKGIQYDRNFLALAFMNRANTFNSLGRHEEAVKNSNECIVIMEVLDKDGKPVHRDILAGAFINRGRAFNSQGRYEEALRDYNESIVIMEALDRDGNLDDHNDLAKAYEERGKSFSDIQEIDQAIADYTQALEIRKRLKQSEQSVDENDLASVFNIRGNLYKMLGRFELALDDIHMAQSLNPNDGYAYATMSEIYAANGNRHKFLENIDLALQHGCPVWKLLEHKDYGNYLDDKEFLILLQRYKRPGKLD